MTNILLGILIITIIVIAVVALFKWESMSATIGFGADVDKAINQALAGVKHATEVSAVLKLLEELDANPNALERIKSYPDTVRAAAMLHRVNSLGTALKSQQKAYEDLLTGKNGPRYDAQDPTARQRLKSVEAIQAQLDVAVKAAHELNHPSLRPLS